MKKRTRVCNSLGEKLNVGMRTFRYGRTPFRSAPGCTLYLFCDPLPAVASGLLAGDGDAAGAGAGDDFCSPLSDGSCRNRSNQLGSTRAPSLLKRGGNTSKFGLPFASNCGSPINTELCPTWSW